MGLTIFVAVSSLGGLFMAIFFTALCRDCREGEHALAWRAAKRTRRVSPVTKLVVRPESTPRRVLTFRRTIASQAAAYYTVQQDPRGRVR